jgi:hypothetical protein
MNKVPYMQSGAMSEDKRKKEKGKEGKRKLQRSALWYQLNHTG